MARAKLLLLLLLCVMLGFASPSGANSRTTSESSSSSATTTVGTIDSDAPTARPRQVERSLPVHTSGGDGDGAGGSSGLSTGAIAGLVIGCVAIVGVGAAVAIRGRLAAQRGDEALFADLGDDNVYFSDYAAM